MPLKSVLKRPVFVLGLVIFAIVFALVGKFGHDSKAETGPSSALVPAITATNNDALVTDIDGDGRADPGDTIEYTVTINNTAPSGAGNDALAMIFSNTLDVNTTLVGSSINSSPIAGNDTFSVTGNVRIQVPDGANDLLANDIDPDTGTNTGLTASGGTTSAQGGNVTINANGSFSYNPPPGFEGTDTFTYTVTDASGANGTGTITFNVSGMVWFINNNAAACTTLAAGCGRLTNPFSTLAAFQALNNGTGNNPNVNDNIFIFESATAYTSSGTSFLAQQKLIGQDATATLATIAGITPAPFSDALPVMNTGAPTTTVNGGAGSGVALSTNNTLRGFSIGNSTPGLSGTGFGTLTLSEVIVNSNSAAVVLNNGTANATFTSVTSTGGNVNVSLTNVAGTVNLGTGALSGATSNNFLVNQGTATISYGGTVTAPASARPVEITNKTGGSVTFTGLVSNTANGFGINLGTNSGATINFQGGLQMNTGVNAAFVATGGGTVNICDENPCNPAATGALVNTLTTGTGTALNVQNTTIGANRLEFRSISANGGANGIFLNSTGTIGGLTVTGDGTNTTKGGNASGGTIQNMIGADATTAGIGIYLNNTSNVVLRRMTINGTIQNNGIYGQGVNNFTLQYSTVGGTIGTTSGSNDLNREAPIQFGQTAPNNVDAFASGSISTIDNCLISGGIQHNIEVYEFADVSSITISNSNITNNSAALGADGINAETHTDSNAVTPRAQLTLNVDNCFFDNNKSQAFQANALGDSFMDVTANANTIQRTTQGNEGIVFQNGSDGDMIAHITNNIVTGIQGTTMFVGQVAGNATAASSLSAVIQGNNVNHSTTPTNRPIIVFLTSTVGQVAPANILVNNNIVTANCDSEAIFVSTPDANTDPGFTATITNNNVTCRNGGPAGTALRGIAAQSTQNVSAGCFDIRTNTVTYTGGTPPGINGLRLRVVGPATGQLEQGGSSGTASTVLAANNPGTGTEALTASGGSITVVSNSTCQNAPTIAQLEEENTIQAALNLDDFINIQDATYQTTSEFLATLKPFVKRSTDSATISNKEIVKAEVKSEVSESPATDEMSYTENFGNILGDASRFVGEAFDKLGAAISPTVYSQETTKTQNLSGETITVNGAGGGFTLPAGKSITIRFRATVDNVVGLTQVSTQGTVSGSNFSSVLTDDPAVGGAANPTVTQIDSTTVTVSSSQNPSITGQSVTFTATLTGSPVHGTGDPGGTVEFFDGATSLGTATVSAGTLNDNTGTATITVSNLTAGTHNITADFSGGGTGPGGYNANNNSNTVAQSVSNTAVWDGSASTAWADGANWTTNGAPSLATNDISIPAAGVTNNPIISAANVTVNNLTLSAGRTLTINTNRTLSINGLLTMNGNNIDATSGVLSIAATGTITRTSGSVLGNMDKIFGATGAFTYPVGTATGFSPVATNVTALGTNPSTLRIRANDGTAPATVPLVDATTLDRYWTLTETGDLTANVTFNYLQADVDGVETNYKTIRVTGGNALSFLNGTPCPGAGNPCVDATANTIFVGNLDAFSDWTAGELAPTAANVFLSGRVLSDSGRGAYNAEVRMVDSQGNERITRTNPFGYFRFEDVEVGQSYVFTIRHKLYEFEPRLIMVNEDVGEIIFTALPEE